MGFGNNVNIVHDPWLSYKNDPYVYTTHEALNDKNVTSLIVTGQPRGDVDLLNDIFIEKAVNTILSIPIQHTDEDA